MGKTSDPESEVVGSNPSSSTKYTTVVVDIYGRVYDIACEHPSWEQVKIARKKSGKKKIDESQLKPIVKNAFTCTVEECARLKAKAEKKKRKK